MNPDELVRALGLSKEEMAELVALFVETCLKDLNKIHTSLEQQDPRGVAEAAHSIKGAAGNMRFQQIYELARTIEEEARQRILTQVSDHSRALRGLIHHVAKDFDIPLP